MEYRFKNRLTALEVATCVALVVGLLYALKPMTLAARNLPQTGLSRSHGLDTAFQMYSDDYGSQEVERPSGKHKTLGGAGILAGRNRNTGISYHGGSILLGSPSIYFIYYGNWTNDTALTILPDFAKSLGGSPYYNINTTYYNASNQHISNSVTYGGMTTDNYSQGKSLSDAGVIAVVNKAITGGNLPKNSNAVYFVLTSADVKETSGFCTQYCGWHTNSIIGGQDIKVAFVGNPSQCATSCEAQSIGPNGNAAADAMVSIIAHEFEESVTDPDLNGWYDSQGNENGDLCAWTYGNVYRTANGGYANMKLGTRNYLVQQNWVYVPNAGGCALSH